MSMLRVAEKTELKELITEQLAEMAEAVNSAHEPELKIIKVQAQELAVESFGLTELVERGAKIVRQRAELLAELHGIQDEQDKVLGKLDEDPHAYRYNRYQDETGLSCYLSGLMPARTEHHRSLLFANTEFGQQLLRIKAKTKSISKDILLATMPEQLTAVYTAFCEEFGIDG